MLFRQLQTDLKSVGGRRGSSVSFPGQGGEPKHVVGVSRPLNHSAHFVITHIEDRAEYEV